MKISVIICTHNPKPQYLERTLAALREQTLEHTHWELLLVDNASDQSLSVIDVSWHPNGRYLSEERIGLTQARLCGIRVAATDLLVFVDDDNLLSSDYLERASLIAQSCPFMGSWSGQVHAEFELPPPSWSHPYWNYLAIRTFDHDRWANFAENLDWLPHGAGLCIRRAVAQEYANRVQADPRRLALDRTGQSLSSYGDIDMALTACDLGLGTGLFHQLKLKHLIPKSRLTETYFLSLMQSMGRSGVLLQYIRCNKPPKMNVTAYLRHLYSCWRLRGAAKKFYMAQHKGMRQAMRALQSHE